MAERNNIGAGIAIAAATIAAPLVGTLGSGGGVTGWYESLQRPWFSPPGWLFGPVWTVLYIMMGVAAWIAYVGVRRGGGGRVLGVYFVQLALNAAWTPVFFGLRWPLGALVVIVLMWVMIGVTVWVFWSVRRVAGVLMLPYWAWVSFAAVLNGSLWWLNRGGPA